MNIQRTILVINQWTNQSTDGNSSVQTKEIKRQKDSDMFETSATLQGFRLSATSKSVTFLVAAQL